MKPHFAFWWSDRYFSPSPDPAGPAEGGAAAVLKAVGVKGRSGLGPSSAASLEAWGEGGARKSTRTGT